MRRFLLTLLVLAFPATTFAQPLADRVPDDAIAYIGWSGTGQMGPEFEQSHLKAVLNATNLHELFTVFAPAAIKKLSEKDPGGGPSPQVIELITGIGQRMWKHPTALAFGGIDMSNPRSPLPRLAVLIDAGGESDALLNDLNTALAQVPREPGMPTVKKVGNVVILTTLDYAATVDQPLSASAKFTAAIGQVRRDGVFAMYADVEALLKLVDHAVAADNDAQAKTKWPKVRDALNLGGIRRFAATAGFDGREWGYRAFVDAPVPRSGITSFLEGKPVTDDALKLIPASATMASAGHFDIAALIEQIASTAQKIDPKFAGQFGMVMGMADGLLGMDLENDLFKPMGSEWASYIAPDVGGNGLLGVTLINRLDDVAKFEAGLNQFAAGFNNAVKNQLHGKDVTIEIRQQKLAGGTMMHYLAVPIITPSWAVKNGNLHLALYPQILASAVMHTPGEDKSILDNEKFTALRKRLEATGATSIQFADLQATVPTGYQTWLLVSRYIGMADIFGIKSPTMLIPPMHVLRQHLAPAGAVTWTDDSGWHMRGISPFPGSETLATDPLTSMGAGQTAMMISILLPSLNRARETANRVKCAANQRQIGQAMLLYSNENRSRYPKTMSELLKTQDITIDVFLCPSSDNAVPPEVRAGGLDAMARWVDEGNSDYVYLGAGKTSSAGQEEIMVYEKPHSHDGDGMNTLHGDGHVEFNHMDQAMQMLQRQNVQLQE